MLIIIAISACFLMCISILHVYWAFGGKWGINAAIPTEAGEKTFTPGTGMTLLVALLLCIAALLLLLQANFISSFIPRVIVHFGSWICMFVFGLRVVGEFNYLGIFKRKKDTYFAKMDTLLFIPLCVFLSFSFFLAIIR
ncbi:MULTISPECIES: DUF3995 domain-containing protein [Bacillus]|uniref:DUF3995 domain-containing protein n=1 Tax=Bacillus TaxID=1386 RepID=UPI00032E9149|nr:DUF3995 domain-containing protein [Bacillus pseudomycoides]EOP54318.1 hypothetical protein IIW_01591 [Bacillus cereus VD136]OOG92763.1 hypothetical protein BTH41_04785 [Bacillus mycoides]PEK58703.1 DUF3995 domain-containing protein [Bacillus pseudomycoides]PEL33286.1 DUF3995 domain-containing protein [Bacillus pseudomycoides]